VQPFWLKRNSQQPHILSSTMSGVLLIFTLCHLLVTAQPPAAEPNPPAWPSSVYIFDSSTSNVSSMVETLYNGQDTFSDRRVALLFKPGTYALDVPVGYYTQVLGLGRTPEDTTFTGARGIYQAESGQNLIRFWRGVENVANRPSSKQMIWSVSQAAPLRRMIVDGDLALGVEPDTLGSGGYVSDLAISGKVHLTQQQQWIFRNAEIGEIDYFQSPTRSVNFVFVGTQGSPQQSSNCTDSGTNPKSPSPQNMVVDTAPLSIEKPYIVIDSQGKYSLVTPKVKIETAGKQWDGDAYIDGFEKVFVATNATDAATINAKLAAGLHVVLSPGIYYLAEPIRIGRKDLPYQVLLGLGLATLVPTNGGAAVEVEDAGGVRIAGLLLQAGAMLSEALLQVGSSTCSEVSAANPILLADVFARVGGPDQVPVQSRMMVEVNASNVIIDNMWLWRADIGAATSHPRDCMHGIVVNGENVTAYGLASEHTQSDNTVWNGEGGRVYFYQSELDSFAHMPEDHTPNYGPDGVSGYRVNAKTHLAVGVGVYVYQALPGVIVQSGVKVLHAETAKSILCPFKWDFNPQWWTNHESTIQAAIAVVPGSSGDVVFL